MSEFKPLLHKHYKLAETQTEKDEDMRRQMKLQNNAASHSAQRANMAAVNKTNNQNANRAVNAKAKGLAQKQQGVANELADRKQLQSENKDAATADNEAYSREQDGLNRQENKRVNDQRTGLLKRSQANDDYRLGRQKEEDVRADDARREKDDFKRQMLGLGTIGSIVHEANANKTIGDDGFIALDGEMDAVKAITRNHSWKGKPTAKMIDGKMHLYDNGKPVVIGDQVQRFDVEAMQGAKRMSDMARDQAMFGEVANGSREARKDSFDRFEVMQKQSLEYEKMLADPDTPSKAKASIESKRNEVEALAEKYSAASEGRVDDRYNLSDHKPPPPGDDSTKEVKAPPVPKSLTAKKQPKKNLGMRNPPKLLGAGGNGIDQKQLSKLPVEKRRELMNYLSR